MSKTGLVGNFYKHATRRLEARGQKPLSHKLSQELCEGVFEYIKKSLKKTGRFTYPGFGTFVVKQTKARTMRYVKNTESTEDGKKPRGVRMMKKGEEAADVVVLEVPEHKKVLFRPNKQFKKEAYEYNTPGTGAGMDDDDEGEEEEEDDDEEEDEDENEEEEEEEEEEDEEKEKPAAGKKAGRGRPRKQAPEKEPAEIK